MVPVTSLQNPTIKLVRSLSEKKFRQETGLFLAEGWEVLNRARKAGWVPEHLVSTEPISINVRALTRASGLSDASSGFVAQNDLRDVQRTWGPQGDLPGPGKLAVFIGFGALPLLWIAMGRIARRRGDPWTPIERRRRRARAQLARELTRAATPRAELVALQDFLGARSAERPQAWQGRDIAAWFARQSIAVPPDAVNDLQRLIADLEAAAWGGAEVPPQTAVRERALSLALRLVRGGL